MSRFCAGDVVKIIATERQPGWNYEGRMDKYIGAVVTVYNAGGEDVFQVYDEDNGRSWIFHDNEAILYKEYCSDEEIEDCNYDELDALLIP